MYITFTLGTNRITNLYVQLQRVLDQEHYNPLPLIYALSSVHHIHMYIQNFKNIKNMRILCSHSILMLPGFILRIVLGPLDLYHLHDLIPELLDFSIQYANWSHLKFTFWIHLNHIPINDMIRIMYILLKQ
jgi:hypothetical protein